MVKVDFYLVRHGFSCANLKLQKKKGFNKILFKDPHLSNWGTYGSIISGILLKDIFNKLKFKHCFCSPLIRTWETALLMLASKKKLVINVAPYLKEFEHKNFSKIGSLPDNSPYSYRKNNERFKEFKTHVKKLYERQLELNKNSSVKKLKHTIDNIDNIKINFSKKKYSNKYTDMGNIPLFIKWYMNKFKPIKKSNVGVVCHSILMKYFLKSIDKDLLKQYKQTKSNNKIIKVQTINGNINSVEIYYDGIPFPDKTQIKKIRTRCSLCKTSFSLSNTNCKNNNELINSMVHNEFINTLLPNKKSKQNYLNLINSKSSLKNNNPLLRLNNNNNSTFDKWL